MEGSQVTQYWLSEGVPWLAHWHAHKKQSFGFVPGIIATASNFLAGIQARLQGRDPCPQ